MLNRFNSHTITEQINSYKISYCVINVPHAKWYKKEHSRHVTHFYFSSPYLKVNSLFCICIFAIKYKKFSVSCLVLKLFQGIGLHIISFRTYHRCTQITPTVLTYHSSKVLFYPLNIETYCESVIYSHSFRCNFRFTGDGHCSTRSKWSQIDGKLWYGSNSQQT